MTILDDRFYTDCWNHWQCKRDLPFVVAGKMPIPYFGNIAAFMNSDIRVVTIGLNPNRETFEYTASREPLDPAETEGRLSSYFAQRQAGGQYPGWFSNYENILNGMGHSYLSPTHGALHVDLCSPLATDPTWTGLNKDQRDQLLGPGRRLFVRLYEMLKPDVVIVSVAGKHLKTMWGHPNCEAWETLVQFHLCQDGITPRANPYDVRCRLYEAREAARALIVFGIAAEKPFGTISKHHQQEVGGAIMGHFGQIRNW